MKLIIVYRESKISKCFNIVKLCDFTTLYEILTRFIFFYLSVSGEKSYHVIVHTGDIKYAGTDANVFLTLFGSKGQSTKIPLSNSNKKSPFERGQ